MGSNAGEIMIIVGVGTGPKMLTQEAGEIINQARLIYGSERAIDLVRDHIFPGSLVKVIEDYGKLASLPEDAVVLSTGDPMLSGLGYLKGRVIPGISSMQVACARLKVSLLKVVPITVHGRSLDMAAIAFELYLESQGLRRAVASLTDLGYPEEKIDRGSTASPPQAPGLSCVLMGEF